MTVVFVENAVAVETKRDGLTAIIVIASQLELEMRISPFLFYVPT